MINQGECPKCGKRLLHVRIESIFGQNNGSGDVRCLSMCCIHCNVVLGVQMDSRSRSRPRRKEAEEGRVVY